MRKVFSYILSVMFIFCLTMHVDAKTLRDLKNQLTKYENEMKNVKNQKALAQSEISATNTKIKNITDTIQKDEIKIKNTEDEIVILEKKAKEKEAQIKDVILYLQIENSENPYIEYIFNASSIEDLILRSAVSEQLVANNDDLINDYNNTIKEYKKKNEDLKEQIVNLNSEQDNLSAELVKLGDSLADTVEEMASVQSQIDAQKKLIEHYEKTLGCKDDQDINTCGKIPYSGKMIRPLVSGAVSSEFGYRFHPTKKYYTLHSGIDQYGSTDVYAVAPGTVAGVSWKNSCGGTMLFVHHNINGKYYTSTYAHLYQVKVKVGDYVDQNTKIAVTGGNKQLTPWDSCTTGRHLHLSIANGLYLKDYTSWSTYDIEIVDIKYAVSSSIFSEEKIFCFSAMIIYY